MQREPRRRRMKSEKITTKDIAQMAGVSRSTVAKALAGDPKIKAETAQRIKEIADRVGFKVNTLARSLKSGRTNIVGCILPDLNDPFYSSLAMELYRALGEAGFKLSLSLSGQSSQMALEEVQDFQSSMAEGLIWDVSLFPQSKMHAAQLAQRLPVVVIGGQAEGQTPYDHVICSDRKGGYDLVQHAVNQGHRSIAFIGPLWIEQLSERIEGYKQALIDNEILPRNNWMIDCPDLRNVMPAIEQWMKLKPRPTAIFAANDYLGINLLGNLEAHGIKVPEDVSLLSFCNIPLSGQIYKPLTTVDLCNDVFANQCVDLLRRRIELKREGKDWQYEASPTLVDTRLVVRSTCGPCPAASRKH